MLCYLAAVAAGSTDGQKMADELIDITAPGGEEFTWQQLPDGDQGARGRQGHRLHRRLRPDRHGRPRQSDRGVFDVYQYTTTELEVVGEVSVEKPNPATP